MEMLTKTHPLVIWGIYLPVICYFLFLSYDKLGHKPGFVLLIFMGGLVFWSFFEYLMHRFVFHFISENPRAQRVIYIMHGNHHEYPRDKERLFMPPVPSLIISSIIFSLMYLAMGSRAFMFFSGYLLGYLLYGSMHYAIHAFNPPFKWMKPLWRNHHLHHYKSEHLGFGVSSTLWDHVFGTHFKLKNENERKEFVKEQ